MTCVFQCDVPIPSLQSKPTPEMSRIYEVVYNANRAACQAARPGVTGEQLDSVARNAIARAGFGEYFTHRTGHGLGLEIHEEPYIVRGATEPSGRVWCSLSSRASTSPASARSASRMIWRSLTTDVSRSLRFRGN